jgi:ABC-type uncharacterized transport system involved in gliding motility auxiliary subunit
MEGDSIDLQAREQWTVPGYSGPYTIGVAIEGKLPSAFAAAEKVSQNNSDGQDHPPSTTPERAVKPVRLIVFGSGYFISDDFVPAPRGSEPVVGSSMAFALNAIDWLTQDEDLIAIRAKTVEDPMLEVPQKVREAETSIRQAVEKQDEATAKKAFEERKEAMKAWDGRKASYRWGNSLAVPGAFALLGIVRWRIRRARKVTL